MISNLWCNSKCDLEWLGWEGGKVGRLHTQKTTSSVTICRKKEKNRTIQAHEFSSCSWFWRWKLKQRKRCCKEHFKFLWFIGYLSPSYHLHTNCHFCIWENSKPRFAILGFFSSSSKLWYHLWEGNGHETLIAQIIHIAWDTSNFELIYGKSGPFKYLLYEYRLEHFKESTNWIGLGFT